MRPSLLRRLPDFHILAEGPLSEACRRLDLQTFPQAAEHVHLLPYGRTAQLGDYPAVLDEGRGTCSTKHAFLAGLALEHEFDELELRLGIYFMNEENTPGVGEVLARYHLSQLPEAHTYLRYQSDYFDFTFPGTSGSAQPHKWLYQQSLDPDEIVEMKPAVHRHFLEQWITEYFLPLSVERAWAIREECIGVLSR